MAGTLTLDTLKTSSGVLSVQNGITGIAKAWVQFVGANGTINQSFNVSSVTRNATGQYTVNYTTALPNSNPTVMANLNGNTMTFGASGTPSVVNGTNTTTTSVIWTGYTVSGNAYSANDYNSVGVVVFCS